MKATTVTILLLFVLFAITVSCGRNRLKTDEKKLANQILTEEEQLEQQEAKRAEREKQLADSIAKLPKGFRLIGDKSIDPHIQPEIIDIAGNLDKIKPFKLSDIVCNIEYVRLQPSTDSTFIGKVKYGYPMKKPDQVNFKEELPLTIIKNNNFIVAYNYLGILLYNTNGQLLRTICKNEFSGMSLYKGGVVSYSNHSFKGANNKPTLIGNKLYYNYEDSNTGTSMMMEVDCKNLPIPLPQANENKASINGIGTKVGNTGKNSYSATPLGNSFFSKTGHPNQHKEMITIFSFNGDTLCSFLGNQKIENYTKTVSRNTDWGSTFTFKGDHYFREGLSDTIFRIVPPNRLIPTFIIDLGEFKIDRIQQAIDPSFDLSNKFLLKSIDFWGNYIFITYTKGYNSPNARKEKLVKFFYAIYDRVKKELWHVQSDPHEWNYSLENDLDGGFPVWPGRFSYKYYTSSSISSSGEILMSIKGNDLKEYIKTPEFEKSPAPADRKAKLKELAAQVDGFETIVIIMKGCK